MIRRLRTDQPMDCTAVGKVLQRFVDAELDERRTARVVEHLAGCAWCAGEADDFRDLKVKLVRGRTPSTASIERMRALGDELAARDD